MNRRRRYETTDVVLVVYIAFMSLMFGGLALFVLAVMLFGDRS